MLSIFNGFRDVDGISILFRMCIGFLCGAVIGFERSYKNRPARFRTHILVCLAATVASMTGQFLYLDLHFPTDVTRIGAQVVSGLGFIGGGTIIVTKKNSVIGLTTAAGLWATGIIGLAVGAGFYEGALLATALVLIAETFFFRVSQKMSHNSTFTFLLEYLEKQSLDQVMRYCKDNRMVIRNLRVTSCEDGHATTYVGKIVLTSGKTIDQKKLLDNIRDMEGVLWAVDMDE